MLERFRRQGKPLPAATLQPVEPGATGFEMDGGIPLAEGVRWNPSLLANPHVVLIGASGSGKTQTLKSIAYELFRLETDDCRSRQIVIDFHGDQEIAGEMAFALHQASPHGINPLLVNPDPEGGGPRLQALSALHICRRALQLGPNQSGLLLGFLTECYEERGIRQEEKSSWSKDPPTFKDLERLISAVVDTGSRDAEHLQLKLAVTMQYGIFTRPQPRELLSEESPALVRLDVSRLPPELAVIAAESLARQLMAQHRLLGESRRRWPRTFLFIDEAREMPRSTGNACDRIVADGRKFGLALVLASQSERHLSADVIANSATKVVLAVDQTEVAAVARKFRFPEYEVAMLRPLEALCRFGTHQVRLSPTPYFRKVGHEA